MINDNDLKSDQPNSIDHTVVLYQRMQNSKIESILNLQTCIGNYRGLRLCPIRFTNCIGLMKGADKYVQMACT